MRRFTAIVVAGILGGTVMFFSSGRAILDGHKLIVIEIDSRSGKTVTGIEYAVRPTLHEASICLVEPEFIRWDAASAQELKAKAITTPVIISKHVLGISGIVTSYGQYSGLAMQVTFEDGTTRSLAVPIPSLRYESDPYVLKVRVD